MDDHICSETNIEILSQRMYNVYGMYERVIKNLLDSSNGMCSIFATVFQEKWTTTYN